MKSKNIIYGLRCPYTDEYKYIGKSINGISRAKTHLTYSHNESVNIWVKELRDDGLTPHIDLLEECDISELSIKEQFWIQFYIDHGDILFNVIKYEGKSIEKLKYDLEFKKVKYNKLLEEVESSINLMFDIPNTIKERRNTLRLSQSDLSELSDISVNTIYKIETNQINPTLSTINSIYEVLGLQLITRTKKPD